MMKKVVNHRDLDVYQRAFGAATTIYALSKAFPVEERYSLTDQIRRSSRAVCSNLAEGWRRRRYEGAFIDKLSVAEGEAAETQVWLEFAVECGYCAKEPARELYQTYAGIIATLVGMINHPESWVLTKTLREAPVAYDAFTPFDTNSDEAS
ncbi:MAG: four helix bundle protein [Caldilineaceae bacterium]